MSVRATFWLRLAGDHKETHQATHRLADLLTEDGLVYDEDWGFLDDRVGIGPGWRAGLVLFTAEAVTAALRHLPAVGAYTIETDLPPSRGSGAEAAPLTRAQGRAETHQTRR